MNIIVAVDENWAIGYKNDLLIRISEDMKYFKNKTMGNIVVMGRKTFESLPGQRPLKNRTNIVLSKDKKYTVTTASLLPPEKDVEIPVFKTIICHDVNEVLSIVKSSDKEVFIIGGEMIYKLFIPYCKKAYVTKIYHKFKADKHIPPFSNNPSWGLIEESEIFETKENIKYQFLVYEKQDE
ncbi:MAG: dihydrofolate reductase [Candidatus Cloacimonetes bacterium]|nr:dihydrofolate reductase [Candidatus Cloacimonadota bacterium]